MPEPEGLHLLLNPSGVCAMLCLSQGGFSKPYNYKAKGEESLLCELCLLSVCLPYLSFRLRRVLDCVCVCCGAVVAVVHACSNLALS